MTRFGILGLSAWVLLAFAAGPGRALAQEADESYYDGIWTAHLPCRTGGGECRARVVLNDFAGTWQDRSGSSRSTRLCGGREMPVTVQGSTRSRLAFTVFGDGVSPQCPTLSIVLKPVTTKVLSGTFESGNRARDLDEDEPNASQARAAPAAPTSLRPAPMPLRLTRAGAENAPAARSR